MGHLPGDCVYQQYNDHAAAHTHRLHQQITTNELSFILPLLSCHLVSFLLPLFLYFPLGFRPLFPVLSPKSLVLFSGRGAALRSLAFRNTFCTYLVLQERVRRVYTHLRFCFAFFLCLEEEFLSTRRLCAPGKKLIVRGLRRHELCKCGNLFPEKTLSPPPCSRIHGLSVSAREEGRQSTTQRQRGKED